MKSHNTRTQQLDSTPAKGKLLSLVYPNELDTHMDIINGRYKKYEMEKVAAFADGDDQDCAQVQYLSKTELQNASEIFWTIYGLKSDNTWVALFDRITQKDGQSILDTLNGLTS